MMCKRPTALVLLIFGCLAPIPTARARPAHRRAAADYYGPFLAAKLDGCRLCHTSDKPTEEDSTHNPFGARLAAVKEELRKAGKRIDIATRLEAVAREDADGDGAANLIEVLSSRQPGDGKDKPEPSELTAARKAMPEFERFLRAYPWKPFEAVRRPAVPRVRNATWVRNPVDAFVAAQHEERGLKPRPEASRPVLLRRLYLDLIGLPPTPEELHAFLADDSPDAYEKVVDRLLASPHHGERWGRHWMDVWRYSDVDGTGNQIFSQPHIWRWRDWIVESLNADRGYDRMVLEMLAADELAPEDQKALRALGFLVRNYNQFYPHVWLQDTVEYTAQALLGVTLRCARCHDHMYDPISQKEYYQVQAIFQPQQVRTDHVPDQPDLAKSGLVRVFDGNLKVETRLLIRGDLQSPEKTPLSPGVPAALGGRFPPIVPVKLPRAAFIPEKRDFVIEQIRAGHEAAIRLARQLAARHAASTTASHLLGNSALSVAGSLPARERGEQVFMLAEVELRLAEARRETFQAALTAEQLEDAGKKSTEEWKRAAIAANAAQRRQAVRETEKILLVARQARGAAPLKGKDAATKKVMDAEKALVKVQADEKAPPTPTYTPRPVKTYPAESTGRRLAFARWVADRENPLTARVAMNHVWLRHFGQALVPRTFDFGRAGPRPTHPALLDWLAAEFGESGWSLKAMHRLLVTSSTYRMASTPDPDNAALDPDNKFYWRVSSRRIEAEVIRDSIFAVAGRLDRAAGGPDIDHALGLSVPRRSLYFRHADTKQMEFLKIFDGPSALECYQRPESIIPQQALALVNSELTHIHAVWVAEVLLARGGNNRAALVQAAFERLLCRPPTTEEQDLCLKFLAGQPATEAGLRRGCERLVRSLMSHYEFRTIR